MYNINFLNKPGIQNFEKFDDKNVKQNQLPSKKKKIVKKKEVISSKNYVSQIILTVFVVLFFGFLYKVYINNNFSNSNQKQNISISYVLKMLRLEQGDSRLIGINLLDEEVRMVLECSQEDCIYQKLKLLNEYNINAKALIDEKKYFLHIENSWLNKSNENWNLQNMKIFIEDFKGIQSEIFSNKLIIVCNYEDLVKLFEMFDRSNLTNLFDFKVEIVEKNSELDKDYYKIFIKEYD